MQEADSKTFELNHKNIPKGTNYKRKPSRGKGQGNLPKNKKVTPPQKEQQERSDLNPSIIQLKKPTKMIR